MYNYYSITNSLTLDKLKNNRFSFCPKDYRKFTEIKGEKLATFLENKEVIGKEIGSDFYMKKSEYVFLKTTNITDKYVINDSEKEFCAKTNNAISPAPNSIFLAKDGGGEGLGEVCFYPKEKYNDKHYISSGIMMLNINEKYRYFVYAFLKHNHFKQWLDKVTPEGSTIRHSKKLALNYVIPSLYTNIEFDDLTELVKKMISIELLIERKMKNITEIIDKELDQEEIRFEKQDCIANIKDNNFRFDPSMYTKEYKSLISKIRNYKYGFFQIPIEKIKSGSTPVIRVFSKMAPYNWVTPTNIKDNGFYSQTEKINMLTSNNINKDCILFINRTSKGALGEYVGITSFYDFDIYGKGHHNQGIYRVEDYDKSQLIFMAAFLNSRISRKICGYMSYGTKMRELKSIDLSNFIFPNFSIETMEMINNLYYNYSTDTSQTGILQLELQLQTLHLKMTNLCDTILKKNLK